MSSLIRSSLLVVALMLEGQVALAQSNDEEAARGHFRDGLARHEARDYDGALRSYRAAYERWKNPKILANIGTVCWELGRYADAANAYERFLTDAPADSPNRGDVERALAEVVPKVGLLEVSPNDPKLRLSVDGQPVEIAGPGRLYVEPGARVLQAQTETGASASQNVSVTAGARARVAFDLTAAPAKPAAPAQQDSSAAVVPTKHSALPWILGGVGIAGLATSGVFYALRNGKVSDLEKVCLGDVCPEASRDSIDSANMYGTLSLVALGVGVAGLGASAALFVTESSKPQANSQVRLTVSAGPGQAGLVARGRF